MSRRINEELVCIDALRNVLLKGCGCREVVVAQGEDPPDFRITIDDVAFPVEVTSIVRDEQSVNWFDHLARVIGCSALTEGILHGSYDLFSFRRPRIPKVTSAEGQQLVQAALTYIRRTQGESTFRRAVLKKDRQGEIRIGKVTRAGANVFPSRVDVKWAGEAEAEIAAQFNRAFAVKAQKLKRVGVRPHEAILVFYDAYGVGVSTAVQAALSRAQGYDWFHSVFWAASFTDRANNLHPDEPGREGTFLFSRCKPWNGATTARSPRDV